tara:strand:+ start:912 stop:1079 length:168 start_codon:yes stop_codon:yes gene_type:complete
MPPSIYLLTSLVLITAAIAILFLGKFFIAIASFVLGIISLVVWTFLGLFEDGSKI